LIGISYHALSDPYWTVRRAAPHAGAHDRHRPADPATARHRGVPHRVPPPAPLPPPRPATGVSSPEFRHAIGHFATGLPVVTSVGLDGGPVGTTASAVSSLSLDPAPIPVLLDRG